MVKFTVEVSYPDSLLCCASQCHIFSLGCIKGNACCFLLRHVTAALVLVNRYPDVDFLLFTSHAQSTFEYPSIISLIISCV